MKFFCYFSLFCLSVFIVSCSGSDPTGSNTAGAPLISNLKIDPNVICVGSAAQITFDVADPNQDPVTWNIQLSTNIHGLPEKTTGTEPSGSHIQVRFKAATSGRHNHRVTLKISGMDPGGLQSPQASVELFVFNCGF